eukprot:739567-Pyramimonas_sp.AAC.1
MHMCGGLWTQEKLFQERCTVDRQCSWCRGGPGTISHRLCECDGLASWRREQGFQELISIGRENPDAVLTTFG